MPPCHKSFSKSAALLMILILSIGILSHAEAGTWSLTGSMSTARYEHAARCCQTAGCSSAAVITTAGWPARRSTIRRWALGR
jgi:hypothetical protein